MAADETVMTYYPDRNAVPGKKMRIATRTFKLAFAACGVLSVVPAAAAERRRCSNPPAFTAYVSSTTVDTVGLLPPSTALDAKAQQVDLLGVLAAQRAAHQAGATQRAIDDSEMTCARFKDVLGPGLKTATDALKVINAGALSTVAVVAVPKKYWKRPRPYMISKEVETLADVAPNGAMATTEHTPDCDPDPPAKDDKEAARRAAKQTKERFEKDYTSYPSGHATFGFACGALLAQMIPEQRAQLYERGRLYGESRVIVGAHFPSDVAQGRIAGAVGVALLMQNATYQRLFYQAQSELRAALEYPAQLPDLEPNKDFFKEASAP
jgi:acid phosphatase (class A)